MSPSRGRGDAGDRWSARRADLPHDIPPGAVAHALCTPPAEFADEDLAWAWRLSFLLLQHAEDGDQLASVARLRQGYLEELQRRGLLESTSAGSVHPLLPEE